jgi:hypothetical protein
MAGYIGSKSSVTQVDGYNRTEADAEFVNDPNSVITVSGSNVGINTSSPSAKLEISHVADNRGGIKVTTSNNTGPSEQGGFLALGGNNTGVFVGTNGASYTTGGIGTANEATIYSVGNVGLAFGTNTTERMRIDSSGNLLVGTTNITPSINAVEGIALSAGSYGGRLEACRDGSAAVSFGRLTSDGDIMDFKKDGTTVGSIGVKGRIYITNSDGTAGLAFWDGGSVYPVNADGTDSDNDQDLGVSSVRFDDIYATNGTIQTSDRNEKQDIEVLSDAEQRVAVACKGLLRKFRWQDAVAEKGDDARIHFGIIAQDLQDAFAAEGLDAGRYAMFISSTWWEAQTEVPAVEAVDAVYEDVVIPAVLDEEGNELEAERTEQQLVTEAVEAKEAYTRTDTYETQAEAPEGATERTRLGVRYPELLAFIIGAM